MSGKREYYAQMAQIIGLYYYGSIPTTVLLSSHGSYVYKLKFIDIDMKRPYPINDKVIKIGKPRQEIRALREQKVICSLKALGFEVPNLEYTQEDKYFTDMTYCIMPWIPSRSLEEIYTEDPAKAVKTISSIGNFIKHLAAVPLKEVDGALNEEEGREKEIKTWTRAHDIFKQHGLLDPLVLELMHESRKILEKYYKSFVHRDGPQVVTDGADNFAVIDWTDAGAGHPLRSLGIKIGENIIWLKEPLREQEWRSWLIQGYLGDHHMNVKMKEELYILTVYYMLLIARSNLSIGNYPEAQRILSLIKDENKKG